MTEQEAISYLECFEGWNEDDEWLRPDVMKTLVAFCTKSLEEIRQYREIGTVEKYREAMEKDRWISVEKKTPEVGEYVLGTNEYGEVLIYYYAWNSPHTKKMFFHLCGAAATITAWMPLPEPYRPEGSGKYE